MHRWTLCRDEKKDKQSEQNLHQCERFEIVNISIQNSDIQNPTLPSLLEIYVEEAAKISLYPIITRTETFEYEKYKKIKKYKCGLKSHIRHRHRDYPLNPINSKHSYFRGTGVKVVGSKSLRRMLDSSNLQKSKLKHQWELDPCINDNEYKMNELVPIVHAQIKKNLLQHKYWWMKM